MLLCLESLCNATQKCMPLHHSRCKALIGVALLACRAFVYSAIQEFAEQYNVMLVRCGSTRVQPDLDLNGLGAWQQASIGFGAGAGSGRPSIS